LAEGLFYQVKKSKGWAEVSCDAFVLPRRSQVENGAFASRPNHDYFAVRSLWEDFSQRRSALFSRRTVLINVIKFKTVTLFTANSR